MNARTEPASWPQRRAGSEGEGASLVWLDALASGICTPEAFLSAMQDQFQGDREKSWEVLSLLDQYYRRGKIKADLFHTLKSSLESSGLKGDAEASAGRPPRVSPTAVTAPVAASPRTASPPPPNQTAPASPERAAPPPPYQAAAPTSPERPAPPPPYQAAAPASPERASPPPPYQAATPTSPERPAPPPPYQAAAPTPPEPAAPPPPYQAPAPPAPSKTPPTLHHPVFPTSPNRTAAARPET